MLADPRSESMVTNFAAQWLYLRDIDAKLPDEILFPGLRRDAAPGASARDGAVHRQRLPREPQRARPADRQLHVPQRAAGRGTTASPTSRAAISAASRFRTGSVRGGLLGQGSILTITSYATRTSPVLRGKWVLENLLSSPPPPPPPDIPSLKTEGPAPDTPLTMRRGDDAASRQPVLRRAAMRAWIRLALRWRTSTRSANGATPTAAHAIDAVGVLSGRNDVQRDRRAEEGAADDSRTSS